MIAISRLRLLLAIGLLTSAGWSICQSAPVAAAASSPRFRFNTGETLTYRFITHMKTEMAVRIAENIVTNKVDSENRVNLELTSKGTTNGVTTLLIETSDNESDTDITGPDGHIVISHRGAHLKFIQNGEVKIDTKKGIRADLAEGAIDREARKSKGELDVDARGNVTDIRGDVSFVEFWRGNMVTETGLFGFIFPGQVVAVGGAWKCPPVSVNKFDTLRFEGKGVQGSETFTRQPDAVRKDQKFQVYRRESSLKQTGLTGYLEQGGQEVPCQIDSLSSLGNGTINFDPAKGQLVQSTTKIIFKSIVGGINQGRAFKTDTTGETTISMHLLPGAALH